MTTKETVGKMIIRRSPKADSICDFILMDVNPKTVGGYKASLNIEQCKSIIALLNKYIRESERLI
ncbi:MAG: hypothetical protein PHG35_03425 [Dehalococcoidales bacterium]|nr:hypothetical protein [Dehalococcoidales bacterium]